MCNSTDAGATPARQRRILRRFMGMVSPVMHLAMAARLRRGARPAECVGHPLVAAACALQRVHDQGGLDAFFSAADIGGIVRDAAHGPRRVASLEQAFGARDIAEALDAERGCVAEDR